MTSPRASLGVKQRENSKPTVFSMLKQKNERNRTPMAPISNWLDYIGLSTDVTLALGTDQREFVTDFLQSQSAWRIPSCLLPQMCRHHRTA